MVSESGPHFGSEPLAGHRLFRTNDLDEAREQVARLFCPHRLELCGRDAQLDTVQNAARLRHVSLHYLDYGADVRITPGQLETFFLIQMPLWGSAEIACGNECIVSTPVRPSVPSPTEHLDMRWKAGTPQLIVRIDRSALERALWKMLGYLGSAPLRFELGLDLDPKGSTTWRRAVRLLREEVEGDGALFVRESAARELENLVMTAILVGHRSNYSDLLGAPCSPAPRRVVSKAVELCESQSDLPMDVAELAAASGTSVRSLQEAFRRDLQTTPMSFIREVRLRRARGDLVSAAPGSITVSEVAANRGFTNLGRFSHLYRARYGELPHETLESTLIDGRRDNLGR